MKFTVLLILSLLFVTIIKTQDQTCQALIMSGGSDLGSYAVGAIQGLYEKNGQSLNYDVVSGIGASSITAAFMNTFDSSEGEQMLQTLQNVWQELRKDRVSFTYKGGLGYGMVYKPGMMDTTPLQNYLKTNLTKPQLGKMTFGATDIDTGKFIRYSEENLQLQSNSDIDGEQNDEEQEFEALLASIAAPGFFPWKNYQNKNVFDGGVSNILDLAGAVQRCKEIVQNDEDIILDIISLVSQQGLTPFGSDTKSYKTFTVYRREYQLRAIASLQEQLSQFFENNPKVQCRYFIEPSTDLQENAKMMYYLSESAAQNAQNQGYEDAKEAYKLGSGVSCQNMQKQALIQNLKNSDPKFYQELSDEQIQELIQLYKQ